MQLDEAFAETADPLRGRKGHAYPFLLNEFCGWVVRASTLDRSAIER
jgi:hypothetical protein